MSVIQTIGVTSLTPQKLKHNMENGNLHKIMVLQQGESDCGVACLQSIIRYYAGYVSLEKLRELSGTQTYPPHQPHIVVSKMVR